MTENGIIKGLREALDYSRGKEDDCVVHERKRSTELSDDVNLIFRLAYYPSSYLRKHTERVTDFTDVPQIVDSMFKTMLLHDGIGLAANQCKLSQRIFVMRTDKIRRAFVNPIIVGSRGMAKHDERCLSFPGIVVKVPRYQRAVVYAQDITGADTVTELEGIEAICAQHEVDHLDGITFVDHLSSIRKMIAAKVVKKALKNPNAKTKNFE